MQVIDITRPINIPLNTTSEQVLNDTLRTSFIKASLGLQIVLIIVFMFMLAISISRTARNVRNSRVMPRKLVSSLPSDESSKTDELIRKIISQTRGQRSVCTIGAQIKEKGSQEQITQYRKSSRFSKVNQMVIQLDSQLLFLQPFLVGAVASNLVFATNSSGLVLLTAALVLFTLFNVLIACPHVKWLSMLFLIPVLGSLIPLFFPVTLPQ